MRSPPLHLLLSWLVLLALLSLTVILANQPLAAFNLPIALAIATAKSLVVAFVFMELRDRSGLVIAFAAAGFFWLFILLWLAGTDFFTRPNFPPGISQRWHVEEQARKAEGDHAGVTAFPSWT